LKEEMATLGMESPKLHMQSAVKNISQCSQEWTS